MPDTKTTNKRSAGRETPDKGWTAEEKAAMKEHAKELKAAARRGADEAAGEADVQAKIADMPKSDREMAKRIHDVIRKVAPELMPRTWYGMPAYAKDDRILCFFQAADKFKARYATFGFNDVASLDDGTMWPTSWALTKLSPADEKKIGELVKTAVS
ncbi:MAG: hypothetical protein QOI85_872 [Chloroflexota bacterium]|nr:hypothetical protein [Chloroflexota bacterium]